MSNSFKLKYNIAYARRCTDVSAAVFNCFYFALARNVKKCVICQPHSSRWLSKVWKRVFGLDECHSARIEYWLQNGRRRGIFLQSKAGSSLWLPNTKKWILLRWYSDWDVWSRYDWGNLLWLWYGDVVWRVWATVSKMANSAKHFIPFQPFTTNDIVTSNHSFGNVIERYWLNSKGLGIYVDEVVPLSATIFDKSEGNNEPRLCLFARKTPSNQNINAQEFDNAVASVCYGEHLKNS